MISFVKSWPVFVAAAVVFTLHLSVDEVAAQRRGGRPGGSGWDFVAQKYDADKNGSVSAKEYTRGAAGFKILDKNGDGLLDKSDWAVGRRWRSSDAIGQAPAVGEAAPDFSLTEVRDKSKTITLSDFAGSKPVALLFGSCT